MNQVLLTRLFKSIDSNQSKALIRVAYSIIDHEKKKGHTKLADKLNSILLKNLEEAEKEPKGLKVAKTQNFQVPVDRRYRLPLANHIEHEYLRHEMVLSEDVETKILRIEKEYLARERLAHHGLKPRKRILLYGPSGCGKSMAGEKIAWDLGLPFYKVRFDSIISSYLGESASNLSKLLESMEDFPCVLLLDEFDIIGKQRNLSSNDVGEIHRIVNILLGLLEEYDGKGILIATTNLEGSLDKALFRRFDDFIKLPKPELNQIKQILKISFSALKLDKKVSLDQYAKKLTGFSYAIIVKIANDAAKHAIINSKEAIFTQDLDRALQENKAINK